MEGVACFRVITRHYLQAHLFIIGLADSPLYLFCSSVPVTEEHLFGGPSFLCVRSQDIYGVLPSFLFCTELQKALRPRGHWRVELKGKKYSDIEYFLETTSCCNKTMV
ncbi:hypothetical protein TNCV_3388901 [Trichonephila clavipes]|nr:hypothetical protein TNCV_3388901 [Trichonephila clavipes]